MIAEGLRLMAVGMIAVFGFLTLLVVAMSASAAFFERAGDRFAPAAESGARGPSALPDEAEIAVALAVATARRQRGGDPA